MGNKDLESLISYISDLENDNAQNTFFDPDVDSPMKKLFNSEYLQAYLKIPDN